MTELISCAMCNRDGRLRLDAGPERVEHDRGKVVCVLPPRDNRLPRITPPPVPAPQWIDRCPGLWKYAS